MTMLEQAVALLRRVEWLDSEHPNYDPYCPICVQPSDRSNGVHAADCELKLFLEDAIRFGYVWERVTGK